MPVRIHARDVAHPAGLLASVGGARPRNHVVCRAPRSLVEELPHASAETGSACRRSCEADHETDHRVTADTDTASRPACDHETETATADQLPAGDPTRGARPVGAS